MPAKKLPSGVIKDWQDPSPDEQGRKKPVQDVIPFRGFVNVNLTAEEKEEFHPWSEDKDLGKLLSDVCLMSYVVSVKEDKKNTCFSAAVTDRNPDSVNAGLCINMRADEPVVALWRLMYVLYAILPGDWEKDNAKRVGDRW
jgi:hypothetical protein